MEISDIRHYTFYGNKNTGKITENKNLANQWCKEGAHVAIIIYSTFAKEWHEIAEMYY